MYKTARFCFTTGTDLTPKTQDSQTVGRAFLGHRQLCSLKVSGGNQGASGKAEWEQVHSNTKCLPETALVNYRNFLTVNCDWQWTVFLSMPNSTEDTRFLLCQYSTVIAFLLRLREIHPLLNPVFQWQFKNWNSNNSPSTVLTPKRHRLSPHCSIHRAQHPPRAQVKNAKPKDFLSQRHSTGGNGIKWSQFSLNYTFPDSNFCSLKRVLKSYLGSMALSSRQWCWSSPDLLDTHEQAPQFYLIAARCSLQYAE